MRKKGKHKERRFSGIICIMLAGMLMGGCLFGAINANAATERAVANKSWDSVERVIETKLGAGYNEVGMCTGFVYWALKHAYGVDWGENSKVKDLEQKLINAGITKVEEGTSGKVTSNMKPGDIVIFLEGADRSHCAILGEGGRLYHAVRDGVKGTHTLSLWMALPKSEKNCDSYIIYRGLISTGTLTVTKDSAQHEITDGNRCYSLAGTQYGLYSGNTLIGTLSVNENGKASLHNVPFGKYILKEIAAGEGYAIDDREYEIVIDKTVVSMELEDRPQVNPVTKIICKIDEEIHTAWNEENRGQYAATLEGALYSVCYYDGYFDDNTDFNDLEPVRSWVISTDKSGQAVLDEDSVISGDPLYYSSDGKVSFPLGTVVIHEMQAPEGYVLDKTKHIVHVTSSGTEEAVSTYMPPIHKEQIIRGDADLIKIEDGTMKRLSGVPFTLTGKSTGEVFSMVTDINGYATTKVEGSRGTLPYDTYILDELPCDVNNGLKLIKDVEISIYKNGKTVNLGTITNDKDIADVKEHASKPETPSEADAVDTGDKLPWQIVAALNVMMTSAIVATVVFARRNRLREHL